MKMSNCDASSPRAIELFFCGEGTTDFGTELDPEGPLQVVVRRTLEESSEEELVFPNKTVSLHHRYSTPRREKDPKKAIGKKMHVSPFSDKEEPRDMAFAFARDVPEGRLGFFHSDVDFTHQSKKPDKNYQDVYDSIKKGINKAACWDRCRPVVPMPRTEAWLLYLADSTLTVSRMKDMKGNDNARKNNPKLLLRALWKEDKNARINLTERHYNYKRLCELPSFQKLAEDITDLLGYLHVSCKQQA